MGTGYTRNDTVNNIADGNVINASDLDGEFDAVQAAFNESTGHTHDGTSAEGAPVTTVGPAQDVNVGTGAVTPKTDNTVDLGSNSLEFKDLYIDGTANIDALVADTADINAGTIDATVIGGSTPAAATVTTLTVNGNTTLGDAATDTVTFTADVASNVIPSADDTYDLGASGSEWKDLYIDGTANIDSLVADTADINAGTIDGVTIGGAAPGVGTFTTANATTVDATNIEVTNIKAKDGSASATIADSTGVMTIASSVLTTADINGGTIDNATIATSNITVGAGKTLDVSAGTLTLANDQISGDKVQGGTIGSTTITTLTSTTGNITTVNATTVDTTNIEVTNIKAKDGTSAGSIADSTGVVTLASSVLTTTDINGGTIDGTAIGGSTAAAGSFTTLNTSGQVVFNDAGADVDFRVEGDTDANLLFVDASADAVGIGTSSPVGRLNIAAADTSNAIGSAGASLNITNTDIGAFGRTVNLNFTVGNGNLTDRRLAGISAIYTSFSTTTAGALAFATDNGSGSFAEGMRIDSSGNVGIGTSSPGNKLTIAQTSNTITQGLLLVAASGLANGGWYHNGTSLVGREGGIDSLLLDGGDVAVTGALSKGSGSFRIDHPLKPKTHQLIHSFIEGPQADLIYRGKVELVAGRAEVNIDTVAGMTEGTFVALNREVQCFTSNESDWDAVRGSVSGNILTIECQNAESSATISWLVIGERQDQHMYDTDWTDENGKVIVEPLKLVGEN